LVLVEEPRHGLDPWSKLRGYCNFNAGERLEKICATVVEAKYFGPGCARTANLSEHADCVAIAVWGLVAGAEEARSTMS